MIRKLLVLGVLSGFVFVSGCAVLATGAATGVGVYSYVEGRVIRTYQASFDQTNKACAETLKSLKITLTQEKSDGIHTVLNAKRTDGTPVTVKTEMIEPRITQVSVRSGYLGLWDKNVSELIHASIAQRLQ